MTLIEPYRVQLQQDLAALEQARDVLSEQTPLARHTIRSIAHSIQRSGIAYGFPALSHAAAELENTPDEALPPQLEKLVFMVQQILETGHLPEHKQALIVGEDAALQQMAKTVLARSYTNIQIVRTANDAEVEVSKTNYDLVLLSLVLPDADGRDLLLRLRERYSLNMTPIFVVAPKTSNFVRSECITLGADEYFEQPLHLDLFIQSLSFAILQNQTSGGKLQREARKDLNTGFLQRAAFTRSFQRAKGLARSANFPLTFIRLSVDGLKQLSTQHVSLREEVLRRIAVLSQNYVQKSALRVRWDSDDLAILLLNTDVARAMKRLVRVQEALAQERILGLGALTPTFSACIVSITDATTLEEAIQHTDYLLHRAKSQGTGKILTGGEPIELDPKPVVYATLLSDDPTSAATVHHLKAQGLEIALEKQTSSVIGSMLDQPPALAIIDLQRPHALTLIRSIRRHEAFRQTPILMLAEPEHQTQLAQGFEVGADDFLLKPFSPNGFLQRVHRLLRQSELVDLVREQNPVPAPERVASKPTEPYALSTPVTVPPAKAPEAPPAPAPTLTLTSTHVPMSTHQTPSTVQDRFRSAFAAAIRERLTRGEPVQLPGLGELRIKHHLSSVKTEKDGSVVVHPPANHIEFHVVKAATSEVG